MVTAPLFPIPIALASYSYRLCFLLLAPPYSYRLQLPQHSPPRPTREGLGEGLLGGGSFFYARRV